MPVQLPELRLERLVADGPVVLGRQFLQRMGQRLGNVTAAERSEATGGVGDLDVRGHGGLFAVWVVAYLKPAIFLCRDRRVKGPA